ncbi:MAG: hypothetical protein ABFC94_13735 [Syntrophomonas sp.]
MKPSVFNNPHDFSFKDLLACLFSAPFILTIVLYMIHHNPADLELIKTLISIEIVVLGGYFGQEVASSYFTRGNTNQYGYNAYNTSYSANYDTSNQYNENNDVEGSA